MKHTEEIFSGFCISSEISIFHQFYLFIIEVHHSKTHTTLEKRCRNFFFSIFSFESDYPSSRLFFLLNFDIFFFEIKRGI